MVGGLIMAWAFWEMGHGLVCTPPPLHIRRLASYGVKPVLFRPSSSVPVFFRSKTKISAFFLAAGSIKYYGGLAPPPLLVNARQVSLSLVGCAGRLPFCHGS